MRIFVRDYRKDYCLRPRVRLAGDDDDLIAAPWSDGEVLVVHATPERDPRGRFRELDLVGGVLAARGTDHYLWRVRLRPDAYLDEGRAAARLLWGVEGMARTLKKLVAGLREAGEAFERGAGRGDAKKTIELIRAELALRELAGGDVNPTERLAWQQALRYLDWLVGTENEVYAGGRARVVQINLQQQGRMWA